MKRPLYTLLVAVLLIVGWEVWDQYREASEKKRVIVMICRSQLGAIYPDLKAYADQHGGHFPAKLSDLVRGGYETQDLFVCPNSDDEYIALGTPTTIMAAEMDDGAHRGSYEYYGVNLTKSSPPDSVLIAESPANHAPSGGHVLYLNGNIDFLNPTDLRRVRDVLEQRNNAPASTTEPS
jgi:hypothetical protein